MAARIGTHLRPLLACRDAFTGLRTGSSALIARGIHWCGQADDAAASRGRFYTLTGSLVAAGYAAVCYPVPAAALEAVGWCVAAWMHAPAPAADGPQEQPVDAPGEQSEQSPADPLPGILTDLIGDAPGVHLPAIVDHLHQTGLDTTCTRTDVKAALTRRGIPTRGSVRGANGRVNEGVHRADLEEWLNRFSPTDPMDTANARSNPATTGVTCDVANPATPVATPPTVHEARS